MQCQQLQDLFDIFCQHNIGIDTALAWKEAIIVPTKIFIWVTPEENMLGNNFLKNNLTSFEILNLQFKFWFKKFFYKYY